MFAANNCNLGSGYIVGSSDCSESSSQSSSMLVQVGAAGGQANGGIDPNPEKVQGVATATFDLDEIRTMRAG